MILAKLITTSLIEEPPNLFCFSSNITPTNDTISLGNIYEYQTIVISSGHISLNIIVSEILDASMEPNYRGHSLLFVFVNYLFFKSTVYTRTNLARFEQTV